jgi:hypothetical protein
MQSFLDAMHGSLSVPVILRKNSSFAVFKDQMGKTREADFLSLSFQSRKPQMANYSNFLISFSLASCKLSKIIWKCPTNHYFRRNKYQKH